MMKVKFAVSVLVVELCLVGGLMQQREAKPIDEWEALDISLKYAKSIQPKNGFVPDENTAARIGEALAAAQYGDGNISKQRPFKAKLRGDVWTVKGTLSPRGAFGGTAVVKLSRVDGRVLFLTHQH